MWGLRDMLDISKDEVDNLPDFKIAKKEEENVQKSSLKVIPFTPLDQSQIDKGIKFDSHFQRVINENLGALMRTDQVFNLESYLVEILTSYQCYSPFESRIIGNIITQELYINSLEHSHEKDDIKECYFGSYLSQPWENVNSENFKNTFLEERDLETIDFFKDKIKIKDQINEYIKSKKPKIGSLRKAELSAYDQFHNQAYLEFTFLDFGKGIPNTLRQAFLTHQDSKDFDLNKYSEGFEKAKLDSKILEYAFKLDSSSSPLSKSIDNYDLVPRGLYFLIDMVRRYSGLITVESCFGKIAFDFSPRIYVQDREGVSRVIIKDTVSIREAAIHFKKLSDDTFFPGTKVTVNLPPKSSTEININDNVLPAVRTESSILEDYAYSFSKRKSTAVHPTESFFTENIEYIPVVFIYNSIIEEFRKNFRLKSLIDIYNIVFERINEELDKTLENSVVFLDFAGLKSGNPIWVKILYFLMNCPKLNETRKAIVLNLPSGERNIIKSIKRNFRIKDEEQDSRIGKNQTSKYEGNQVEAYKSALNPLLFRPIPCVEYKLSEKGLGFHVEWIGLKNESDSQILTQLLLGEVDSFSLDDLTNASNIEANVFAVDNSSFVHLLTPKLKELRGKFIVSRAEKLETILSSYTLIGENATPKEIYLATNGSYQEKYLSLYDLLHDKYVARYFAHSLMDIYVENISKQGVYDRDYNSARFDKIIAVTVSSQLIGIAIRDLIEQEDLFDFFKLSNTYDDVTFITPDLVLLSNYYSFESEKPFESINRDDQVVIVGDVISTGQLMLKLRESIEIKREATINGFLNVADSRISKISHRKEKLVKSEFLKDENHFSTLVVLQGEYEILKFLGPYNGDRKIKRINPLLNSIIDLSNKHSEEEKILFRNPNEVLDDPAIQDEFLKIGHYSQNLTHNGYLTDMRYLFSSPSGVGLLKKLQEELCVSQASSIWKTIEVQFDDLLNSINATLLEGVNDPAHSKTLETLKEARQNLEASKDAKLSNSFDNNWQPDYIFYPVFSGIEKVSHLELSNIFGTHADNIIGLQRFDTPKGWRFPFPAKRFNELTFRKDVLILDSGSLTGESLIQLIDTIGFLQVERVVVLSIVTRIEDHTREFYSRLKSLYVKKFKSENEEKNIRIPLEIYFGINLHLPVYSSSVSCPFCEEIAYLESIESSAYHLFTPPPHVKDYITNRKQELKVHTRIESSFASYLPLTKESGHVDSVNIFKTRDLLGRIDSYRFYPEYFEPFNQLEAEIHNQGEEWISSEYLRKQIELILTCVLHEEGLVDLILNFLPNLYKHCTQYMKRCIVENDIDMYYSWSFYSKLRVGFSFFESSLILVLNNFESILSQLTDEKTRAYLNYKIWDYLYNRSYEESISTGVERLLQKFGDNYHHYKSSHPDVYNQMNLVFFSILTKKYKVASVAEYTKLDIPFYNLSKFVRKGESQNRHFILKERLGSLLDSIISNKPSLEKIKEEFGTVIDIFEYELRPNLEIISSDPYVEDQFPTETRYLGSSQEGILFYMDTLKEIHHEIVDSREEDLENFEDLKRRVSENCKILINDILVNQENSQCFYGICKKYPADIKDSLELLISKWLDKTKITIEYSGGTSSFDTTVNWNKALLDAVFEQIIQNAVRKYGNDNLEMTINCEASTINEIVNLTFYQNKPFVPYNSEHIYKPGGGIERIISHYTEQFNGVFDDNSHESVETGLDYEIYLTLNLHVYEN